MLNSQLALIDQLVAAGQNEKALQQIDQVIKEHPSTEAHHYRLRLLAADLTAIRKIGESLDWLTTNQADDPRYADAVTVIQDRVASELTRLQAHVDEEEDHLPLIELDKLLPLADRFPAIHFVRGLAQAKAARLVVAPEAA